MKGTDLFRVDVDVGDVTVLAHNGERGNDIYRGDITSNDTQTRVGRGGRARQT